MTDSEPKKGQAQPADAAYDGAEAGEPETGPAEAAPAAEPSVEERIAALEAEREQLRDKVLRALADAENTRRRAEREREDTAKFAISQFARDLLSVADNLRRALEATSVGEANIETLVEGVAATERELLTVFERHGIVRIDAAGERFDPNLHQAMFEVADSGEPAGTVVQVLAPGYLLHGRLLRPAMVGVAKDGPAAD